MLESVWEGKLVTATVEDTMEIPLKTKVELPIWSSNRTPGHISKQNCSSKIFMHPYVQSSSIHDNQDMETN